MKSDFKKQLWLNFGIVAMSVVLACVGIYLIAKDVDARTDTVVKYRMEIAAQNGNLDEVTDLRVQAMQAQQYQTAIETLLPSQDALVDFPMVIAAMGKSYNVNATADFTGIPVPSGLATAGSLVFSLNVTGRSLDIARFMTYMETQTPEFIVAIDSFSFAGSDPTSQLNAQGIVFFE